ncbi:ribbon-helix-helix protein, CopG family [Caldifermentibacillus hisashii]|uniref:ribbon-helix-helix protein, CopG family n=1 Tax=Caldifermentibacillus hisashii TaxID=996558 RepID=UPI003D233CBC
MVRIFVKSSHNPFHELFSFNDLEPFIKDGDWFVMDGNLYVRSNYRKTQITLPVSMIENLQSMAKEQDITTSQLIEKIIEDYEERRDK